MLPSGDSLGRGVRAWSVPLICGASLCFGLFWTAGVLLEEITRLNTPAWALAPPSLLLAVAVVWLPARRRPGRWSLPTDASLWRVAAAFVFYTVAGYVALTPLCWLLGKVLVLTTWPDPNHSQAGLFALILALWLPCWWAPGLGALVALWYARRRWGTRR